MALLIFAACGKTDTDSQTDASERTDSRPTIVFLGDSLTAGLGLAPSEAVPALIEKKLLADGKNYRVINAGRSGDTSAGGLARLNWYLQPEINLRYLVIGLGSNDAMRGLSLEELEKNLREIIRRTRAHDRNIKIFIYQMYTFPNMGREYKGRYDALFPRVARTENIILLPFPLTGVAANPRLNQKDGVHPTAEGTRIEAENIWKSFRGYL